MSRFGYLTRRWGWTADNLAGMDVVTADGQLVRASRDENSDLFWGLRGGGGNFGVVTGIDYILYPVGPEIVGGVIAWPASEAPKVLEMYRWNDMRPFSTGGTYINFLTEEEGFDRIEAALGKQIQRLAAIKAKWDPQNIFRTNRNIEPAR